MRAGGRCERRRRGSLSACGVPCGANTGKAETVVVRAVRRKAVVMKAVSKRMDRVKEEGTERAR